jgi:soluble lytic murein transglycosylase-like protein
MSNTKRTLKPLILLSVCLCMPVLVSAEIYKYQGSDGSIYFTDKPMKGNYRLLWRSGKEKRKSYSNHSLARLRKNKAELTPLIDDVAKQLHLHPGLLHAVVMVESAYDPKAISKKGARGLMQLMPATANRYGVIDSYDPKQNLQGGAQYLKDLLKLFEFDIKLALAAYNAGENAVSKYGNTIPPYAETQNYVTKVLNEFERNRLAMLN